MCASAAIRTLYLTHSYAHYFLGPTHTILRLQQQVCVERVDSLQLLGHLSLLIYENGEKEEEDSEAMVLVRGFKKRVLMVRFNKE